MTYEEFISNVVKVVEATGAAILVFGGLWALLAYVAATMQPTARHGAYQRLRQNLGRVILLGLEVLIIGDIVRTIIVDPDHRECRRPGDDRRDSDRPQLLARGGDRWHLAVEPLAARERSRRVWPRTHLATLI